jgi:hypothetical protein
MTRIRKNVAAQVVTYSISNYAAINYIFLTSNSIKTQPALTQPLLMHLGSLVNAAFPTVQGAI